MRLFYSVIMMLFAVAMMNTPWQQLASICFCLAVSWNLFFQLGRECGRQEIYKRIDQPKAKAILESKS